MKKIRRTLLLLSLLLAGILGTRVALFAPRPQPVPVVGRVIHGNECVTYQRPPVLDAAEAKPILDRAVQRILQRLIQARDRWPALSDVGKAVVEDCGFTYQKGSATRDAAGKSVCEPPDSCCLSLHARYPFADVVTQSAAPSKAYALAGEGLAYYTWLVAASGTNQIHRIIEREMDRAAGELETAALSKMLKAGEAIHIAVRSGDAAKVEQLLAAKPEWANARDSRGYTPLHWARDAGIAERLLARKADVNAADRLGLTPLHWAVYEGRFEVVKTLVAHQAGVNRKAGDGWTPTSLAEELRGEDGPITRCLLQHGGVSEIPDVKLNHVVSHPGTPSLKRVLRKRPDLVVMTDGHGRTALHNAVALRDKEAVELLLGHYADADVRDEKGETALEQARRLGLTDIAARLLKYMTMKREEVIHNIIVSGNTDEVKRLLASQPAIVNEKHSSGWMPIHGAVSRDDNEMLKLLLERHAGVNARNFSGQTALHIAVMRGRRGRDSRSQEARDALIKEAITLLLAHGADVDARDGQGATALHYAAGRTDKAVVELLLANRADVNATDARGRTPLDYAAATRYHSNGYPVSVLLRKQGGWLTRPVEGVRSPTITKREKITRDGVPITGSQLNELQELPEVKAAREALQGSSVKYNATMNALMAGRGYRTGSSTNSMPDGTMRVDRQYVTASGVPMTPEQMRELHRTPELKALRKAGMEANGKYIETMRTAAARLGYQYEIVYSTGFGSSAIPAASRAGPSTNEVARVQGK